MNPLLLCFAPSLGGCGASAGMCVLGRGKKLSVPDRYNCTLRGAYRDIITSLQTCLCQDRPRQLTVCG